MALDRNNEKKGYLLGRLFAVFEKVQQETHPGLNATITDRFYGAASTNPVTVFTQLMRLNRHHLSSYENEDQNMFSKHFPMAFLATIHTLKMSHVSKVLR